MEEGILICSGPGMAERRIAMGDVSGWLCNVESDPPVFQLLIKGGGTIDLQDPRGELKNALATLSNDFVNLDETLDKALKSSGRLHVDERLGRFSYSDGVWGLRAKVDLPFQADVPIGFDLEIDLSHFPKSMPKNVLWIQDNLGEIWNAAARVINALVEAEGISPPQCFALQHLWANIPDAALDVAEWKFTVEVKDMYESFEVVFHGLEAVSCNAA
jgi:hypothetical protein